MTDIAILTAGTDSGTTGQNANYFAWGGLICTGGTSTTEANQQVKNRGAGTLQNVYVRLGSNGNPAVLTSRLNGAAGNITCSSSSSNVTISDLTHTDSVADGDLFNGLASSTGGSVYVGVSAQFASAGQAFRPLTFSFGGSTSMSGTVFVPPAGGTAGTGTEASTKFSSLESATLSNLQINVTAKAGTNSSIVSRIAGANGNQTITINTTGLLEDTTHTDSVSLSTNFNSDKPNNVSGSNSASFVSLKYLGSTASQVVVAAGSGFPVASSAATNFWPFGKVSKTSTEANTQLPIPASGTASSLAVTLTVNTNGSGQNFQFRNNGGNGNQIAVTTASTTGTSIDSTHTDSIVAGDLVNASTASTFTTTSTVSAYGFLFVVASGVLTLSGQAATGAAGTLSPGLSIALTGLSATGSVGTLSPATGLAGFSATGSIGTLAPSTTVALTGLAATGSAGTLAPSLSVALTGQSVTGAIGSLQPSTTVALTGVAGTGTVGTLGPATSVALVGLQATGSVGTLTVPSSVTVALTGVSGTGQTGSLVAPQSVILALTGLSVTGSLGTLAAVGWSPNPDQGEIWTPVGDQGEIWAPVSQSSANWTNNDDQTEIWSVVPDTTTPWR